MYQDRERDHGQRMEPASDVASDEQEEQSRTRFSSSGPLPPVDSTAGPAGPTASDRAYGTGYRSGLASASTGGGTDAEQQPDSPSAEPSWVASARAYNDQHQAQVADFDQRTGGVCIGADGQLDPNLVADWQLQHGVSADGRVSPETLEASMSWLTAIAGAGATAASTSASSEDDAEKMRKLKEAADADAQLLDSINLT